jgi:hypothetical protein
MSEQTTTATTEERPATDELPTVEVGDAPVTATVHDQPEAEVEPTDVRRRVEAAGDPAAHAQELAERLDGDVAADVRATEAAVRARRDAARLVLADASGDADLLARADAIRAAAAAPPPVGPEQVAEVRQLAAELRAASRIRERTEARAADDLRERMSASAGLTVHPAAIRAAAEAVAEAAAAVADAELSLAEAGEGLVFAERSEGEIGR